MLEAIEQTVKYAGYKHIRSYDPDDILSKVGLQAEPLTVMVEEVERKVNVESLRLQCFKRSKVCVGCGLTGTIMSLDTFKTNSVRQGYHFNLYAKEDGKTRLMTKDHIIPKSKGGPNHLDNLQTMCDRCNCKKGSKLDVEEFNSQGIFGDTLGISIGVENE